LDLYLTSSIDEGTKSKMHAFLKSVFKIRFTRENPRSILFFLKRKKVSGVWGRSALPLGSGKKAPCATF
jgi:hypothetical protein